MDRCNEPGDWLRREIEIAIEEKRNIVPLLFKGFQFGTSEVKEKLRGKLKNLSRYNGLNVHEDYFGEAMQRLRAQYLNKPLDTVLHPVSTEVQKVVKKEQVAADKALEKIENVQELVKEPKEKLARDSGLPKPVATQVVKSEAKHRVPHKAIPWRLIAGIAGGILIIALCFWGGINLWNNLFSNTPEPTRTLQPVITNTPSPTQTSIPPTPTLGIGSTMTGKDGMTLLYVPTGEFMMGSEIGAYDEKPVHTVNLGNFWIDKTEVTNAMYAKCVGTGVCKPPASVDSYSRVSYYDNSAFDNYPVIYVDWNMAKTYCEWVDRRLPTEAEWEKAARGTDQRIYPWGNDSPNNNLLNYNFSVGDTTEVGRYPNGASPYGALDMAGNVWEWVADWYGDTYYASSPDANPLGPDSGTVRVLRGGSWSYYGNNVRSSYRYRPDPSTVNSFFIGFRCAMSATP